ncbi:MAG: class I SAM-dependent methyltransferase [Candidatus Obscuribacterales bacterium]|nr:class I SAM-dependent methyltransferase [Candidatus Obscuribacterales bacterium]
MARSAADIILQQIDIDRTDTRRFVDLGCGSGLLSQRMSQAGFDVTGFDISPAMIALSKKRVPAGNFREQSIFDADIPPCAVVAAVGEIINYLFDKSHSLAACKRLFRRVADALESGGIFLIDGATPGRGQKAGGYQGFREGPGWFCLYHAVEEGSPPILTRTITTFRQEGELFRKDGEVHRLRLIEPTWVRKSLEEVGLRVQPKKSYGQVSFPKGYFALWASKPRGRSSEIYRK